MTRHVRLDLLLIVILVIVSVFTLLPLAMMLNISLKSMGQFAANPLWITYPLHFENYLGAVRVLWRPVINTAFVAGMSILGTLCTSALAAYAFARFRFPGHGLLFYLVLSLLMIPGVLLLVPRYVITAKLHLTESFWGLIVPYIAGGQIFNVFVLRTFFASIPQELLDAARIDGAGDLRIFGEIVLPLSKPILGTLSILQLLGIWNDFIWPFVIITKQNMRTLTVQLRFLEGMFGSEWGMIMAGYAIGSLPLVLLFALFTKPFIEGMTSGAIKA
jgi:ABC-type glycerol-3-phosphate transport system permease component